MGELGEILVSIRENPSEARVHRHRALRLLEELSREPHTPHTPESVRETLSLCDGLVAAYPESSRILSAIGSLVKSTGRVREACGFYQKALAVDPSDADAEDLLNDAKNSLVARWHYRMLNDSRRNSAYRRAIERTVGAQDAVLDVGCGCGLLSYYAARAGAREVLACDSDPVMFDIAKAALSGFPGVSVVEACSLDLQTERPVGGRSVVVAEIFDAGLLGEGALGALSDARKRLMVPRPGGKTIPRGAKVYVCGVRSRTLAKRCRFVRSESNRILNHFNFGNLNLHRRQTGHYDTENLSFIEDVAYATDAEEAMSFDFDGEDRDSLNSETTHSVRLKASEDGRIDAYVLWFDLILTDDISLTTDPRSPEKCSAWDNALFYLKRARKCKKGEIVSVAVVRRPDRIEILDDGEDPDDVPASDEVLKFLNDADYVKAIDAAAGAACVHIAQSVRLENVKVLDYSPFPVLGLLTLMRGARRLVCNSESIDIIEKLSKFNEIDLSKIMAHSRMGECDYEMLIYSCLGIYGHIDSHFMLHQRVVRFIKLKTDGITLPNRVRMVARLVYSEHLNKCNRVFEENLFAGDDFKVADRLNAYQVTQNSFPSSDRFDKVFLSNEVTLVAQCLFAFSSETVTVPVTKDGLVNAVQCYYKIQLIPNALEISTDRADSHIDNVYHLLDPPVPVRKGCPINILFCSDVHSSSVKVVLDTDD